MKRILAISVAVILLFVCSGCSINMRGDTLELDLYPADTLLQTFNAIKNDELKIEYTVTETLPKLKAQILNHPGKAAHIINIYLYNESTYDIQVNGYTWFISGENQCKGIYYNAEKKVSNSTYKVKLDSNVNGYFLYELLINKEITVGDYSIAFLFFKYEDTQYICGIDSEGTLLYWPKAQTLSSFKQAVESK